MVSHLSNLEHKKLTKLLYLIDESAIKDGGIAVKENNISPETDTDYVLDLSQLVKNDSEKLAVYREAEEIAWFRAQMKAS